MHKGSGEPTAEERGGLAPCSVIRTQGGKSGTQSDAIERNWRRDALRKKTLRDKQAALWKAEPKL